MKTDLQLDQTEQALQVLNDFSESFTRGNGCPMNDCMWHALAYIGSKGAHYSETDARKVCAWYYNRTDIYQPFKGNKDQARDTAKRYVNTLAPNSYSKDKIILVYDTGHNESGELQQHAVILDKNNYIRPGAYYAFDPQANKYISINFSSLGENHYEIRLDR